MEKLLIELAQVLKEEHDNKYGKDTCWCPRCKVCRKIMLERHEDVG